MFYIDNLEGKKIVRSDLIKNADIFLKAFFIVFSPVRNDYPFQLSTTKPSTSLFSASAEMIFSFSLPAIL